MQRAALTYIVYWQTQLWEIFETTHTHIHRPSVWCWYGYGPSPTCHTNGREVLASRKPKIGSRSANGHAFTKSTLEQSWWRKYLPKNCSVHSHVIRCCNIYIGNRWPAKNPRVIFSSMSDYSPQEDRYTLFLEKTFMASNFVAGIGYGASRILA